MQKPIRAAIYVRVSTQDQSCEMQLRDLRQYAQSRGLEIIAEFEDVISGAKEKRPKLDELMNQARKRKFDVVLVWRFDRFARSTKHLVTALNEFRSLGIQFISYNENIDTTSPIGEALFTILASISQLERDIIRERVRAGIRHARANGKSWGRAPQLDSKQLAQLRSQGLSFSKIAALVGCSKAGVAKILSQNKTA